MRRGHYRGWAPYVPVAVRRHKAALEASKLAKNGRQLQPVAIQGRRIASSFWGSAWCDNLEAYSDYENRLPRGRTYVRNGSVIDLVIESGKVRALVSGSSIYRVEVEVDPLDAKRWQAIVGECTGKIGSLVEVLQGRLSKGVMEVVTRPDKGLFPQPRQMRFACSCPDWASMCKHVAAALYGVGARLDAEPELLFELRHVRAEELVERAVSAPTVTAPGAAEALEGADLSALFGIDIAEAGPVAKAGAKTGTQRAASPSAKASTKAPGDSKKPAARAATPVAAKTAAKKVPRAKTISATELLARGVPRHMIQSWLASGVLARGPGRGVYRTTPRTEPRIRAYLDRTGGR